METSQPQTYIEFPRMLENGCRMKGCTCARFEGLTDLPDERCSNCFHSIEAHTLPTHQPIKALTNQSITSPNSEETSQIIYRKKIAQELLTTERSYVKMLTTCLRCYADPLYSCTPPVLPTTLYKSIFLFYRDIVRVNIVFLHSLERLQEGDTLDIGLVGLMLGTLPYFRVYRMFVGNNSVGLQAIEEAERIKAVRKLLIHCSHFGYDNEAVQPLRSYLILPIQRIPRYSLFFSDMLKHTSVNDSSYEELTALVGSLRALSQDINDEVKLQANRRKMLSVKSRFCEGPYHLALVQAHRYVVREGFLMKLSKTKPKQRYFYLFNDIVVYGRLQMKLFYPNLFIQLSSVRIEESTSPNAFALFSPKKSFTIICNDIDQRNLWSSDFKNSIEKEVNKKFAKRVDAVGFDAPLYQPFNEVTECFICKKKFNFFFKKHHCNRCGFIVCSSCSKQKKIIPPNPIPQTICTVCVKSADENVKVFKGLRKRSKLERDRLTQALLD
ncbi:Rho/RAC guanine nucleotide exchange factor [Entamoeba marina]